MKILELKNFTKGWLVGDFEPSLFKTKEIEVAVKYYRAGDAEARHVHKIAREITLAVSGKFKMNGRELSPGDMLDLPANEPADFFCIEDGATLIIKMPSAVGDKYPA